MNRNRTLSVAEASLRRSSTRARNEVSEGWRDTGAQARETKLVRPRDPDTGLLMDRYGSSEYDQRQL